MIFDILKVRQAQNLDSAVLAMIFLLYFTGAALLLLPTIKIMWFTCKTKMAERMGGEASKVESEFNKTLRYMLSASGNRVNTSTFKLITGSIFAISVILTIRVITPFASCLFGCIMATAPYIVLRFRLESSRTKSSAEAEDLLSALLIQYRINNCRIEDSIQGVLEKEEGLIATKPLLFNLLICLRGTRNKTELRAAADLFGFAVGTKWAGMLSHNIYNASVNHVNISLTLEDILVQLRDARMLAEEAKRSNLETGRLFFFIPVLYAGFVFTAVKYCDMPLSKYIENQLGTKEGLISFVAIAVMTVVCYFLISISKSKKFDF